MRGVHSPKELCQHFLNLNTLFCKTMIFVKQIIIYIADCELDDMIYNDGAKIPTNDCNSW